VYAKSNTNLLITPHIGGSTYDAWRETEEHTINGIISTLNANDKPPYNINSGIWALIPARGGSKTIPLKNMVLLDGKPLIDYAIECGKSSSLITKVICSTDNEKIANHCKEAGVDIQIRPDELSKDNVTTVDVILYFLRTTESKYGALPEFLVLLEPTSPFVKSKHIDSCIEALRADVEADSAQTVTRAISNAHAYNQRYHDETGSHFLFDKERKFCTNKQLKPNLFIHGNVRVMRTSSILKYRNIFGMKSIPIEIPRIYSIDVDGPDDLDIANIVLKSNLLEQCEEK